MVVVVGLPVVVVVGLAVVVVVVVGRICSTTHTLSIAGPQQVAEDVLIKLILVAVDVAIKDIVLLTHAIVS